MAAQSPAAKRFTEQPPWRVWMTVGLMAASAVMLLVLVTPAGWRPAWLTSDTAQNVFWLFYISWAVVTAGDPRTGASLRPAERLAFAGFVALFAIQFVDGLLEPWGRSFIPPAYKDGLFVATLGAAMFLMALSVALNQIDAARRRRHDIAMGE